jgi:hypothetical protein
MSAGGEVVVITGTDLITTSAVTFGGTAATNIATTSTTVTVTTPAHAAGLVNVVLTTMSGGTATKIGAFTFTDAPTVTSLNTTSGPASGSSSVVITGTNLSATTSVTFGGTVAAITGTTATSVTVTTPAHAAGLADVVVTSPGGSVTSSGAYTYIAAPTITGLTPINGPLTAGTIETITGTALLTTSSVTIDGNAATLGAITDTQVVVTLPAGTAGAKTVVLTATGGSVTRNAAFTYIAAPTITSLDLTVGSIAGGTTVHISGTNLATVSSVSIDGISLTRGTGFNYLNPDIVIVTPAHAAGAVSITVTTVGGSVTDTNVFTYAIAPTITVLDPATGPSTGGTSVNIRGTNLSTASAIRVGGIDVLASLSVIDDTWIIITTPATANFDTGTVTVDVTANGITATSSFVYFLPAPTISTVTLSAGGAATGPLAGGSQIRINGSNFFGFNTRGVVVTIGGVAASIDTAISTVTSLEVLVPAGTVVGAADIVVTTTLGTHVQTVSLVGGFIYI